MLTFTQLLIIVYLYSWNGLTFENAILLRSLLVVFTQHMEQLLGKLCLQMQNVKWYSRHRLISPLWASHFWAY